MMRYFLHIEDGLERIVDEEGSELPDLAAAREEALVSARQLWAAAIIEQRDLSERRFLVTNNVGDCLLELPFLDALPIGLRCRLRSAGD
jgi:hypothetical protein